MMVSKIERDHTRFRQIVRGKIKKELKRYITQGELIGKKGKELVSIPLPQIDLPRFRYETRKLGGVGQGEGDSGTPIGGEGDGQSGAGDLPGQHILEVDVSLDELAAILGEELELPRIEPRGKKNLSAERDRYSGIRTTGPETLRIFKRTFKEALRRQLALGIYEEEDPVVIPVRDDKRYRSWKTHTTPQNNAVIIYMMDVSGSMGDEQKEIVRIESFWIDTWLSSQYKGIQTKYIIHDAVAREVDRHAFYHTRQSGGTKISSAYKYCHRLLQEVFQPSEWNVYAFHFSDGDNWSGGDTNDCVELLREKLLPACNLFCYGQVESPYGSGQFLKDLKEHFQSLDNLVFSEIKDKDGVYDSIKEFLGKGR